MKKNMPCSECGVILKVNVCCDGKSCDCKGLPEGDVVCNECKDGYVEDFSYIDDID